MSSADNFTLNAIDLVCVIDEREEREREREKRESESREMRKKENGTTKFAKLFKN